MTKEEFLKELKETFTQNGNWFNYQTPMREISVSRTGILKAYHTFGFKLTDKSVYFCFKDFIDGHEGCFQLRGNFNIKLLSESKNVNELINAIKKENSSI